jgi:tetratricopeptide (TPR) repeat protein
MRWCAVVWIWVWLGGGPARSQSVAVLPFANASGPAIPNAGGMDWIGAGIAETVREALAGQGVYIISREEVAEGYAFLRLRPLAQLTQASVLKLGEALNVDRILYGVFSYQLPAFSEGRGSLTIRARIFDRRMFVQSGPIEENGPLEGLPDLEAHLSWQVLKFLAPESAPPESEFGMFREPVRLDARENYVRGLLASDAKQREKFFLQASRLEPSYWRPALELGKIFMARKTYREAATWLERVQPSDSGYAEAAFLLGIAKFQSGDTRAAQEIFERLAPLAPLGEVFNNLGAAQSRNGRAAAAENFRKALAADPSDPDYHFNLAYILWKTGDFEGAADSFRAVLERDPGNSLATLLLGRSISRQGLRKDAAADARLLALERLKDSIADPPGPRSAGRRAPVQ